MSNDITLVSICCCTYNHQDFLEKCLDGFISQKTNFPFEILVHEDASTDSTASILRKYEEKYPHLIRCVYQKVNQFALQNVLVNILFPMAKGKYIALCEGDDYWTDPYKLQKQVDLLEHNSDCALCFTKYGIKDEINNQETIKQCKTGIVSAEDIIPANLYSTATVLFKTEYLIPVPQWFPKLPFGDWSLYLIVIHMSGKKAHCLEDITTVYRIHGKGMHGSLHASNMSLIKAYEQHIDFYEKIQKYLFKGQYASLIEDCIKVRKKYIAKLLLKERKPLQALIRRFS